MRPYYDADGIVIYHGDCEAVLAALPEVADPDGGKPRHGELQRIGRLRDSGVRPRDASGRHIVRRDASGAPPAVSDANRRLSDESADILGPLTEKLVDLERRLMVWRETRARTLERIVAEADPSAARTTLAKVYEHIAGLVREERGLRRIIERERNRGPHTERGTPSDE